MGFCRACGGFVARQQMECPDCGAPVRKVDQKSMGFDPSAQRLREQNQRVMTANHEQRKFMLQPRQASESDEVYIQRIDREKTPYIEALARGKACAREREPGDDDDKV